MPNLLCKEYYTRRLLLPCLIHKRSCFWPTSSSLAASCRIVDSHKGFKKSARGLDYIWTGGRRRVLADILRRGVSSRRWGQTFLRICAVKWVKDKQPQSRHTKSKMCRQNLKKLHWKKKEIQKKNCICFCIVAPITSRLKKTQEIFNLRGWNQRFLGIFLWLKQLID